MEVSPGFFALIPHNIVQTSVILSGVLGSFHLDYSQWIRGWGVEGGGCNMSCLELTRDALTYFIHGVDNSLVLICVVL